jgi:hypothetical protein
MNKFSLSKKALDSIQKERAGNGLAPWLHLPRFVARNSSPIPSKRFDEQLTISLPAVSDLSCLMASGCQMRCLVARTHQESSIVLILVFLHDRIIHVLGCKMKSLLFLLQKFDTAPQ